MATFSLFGKAKLDKAFHRLAAALKSAVSCDDVRPGYQKHIQGSHVVYFKQNKINSFFCQDHAQKYEH